MPTITYTYRCGHAEERKAPRRDFWRLAYGAQFAPERNCRDCIHAAESAQASLDARNSGLPALAGKSERQRAYGETCRAFVLERMVEILDGQFLTDGVYVYIEPMVSTEDTRRFRDLLAYMRDRTDAGWWCDLKSVYDGHGWTGQRAAVIDHVMYCMGWCQVCLRRDVTVRRRVVGPIMCEECERE